MFFLDDNVAAIAGGTVGTFVFLVGLIFGIIKVIEKAKKENKSHSQVLFEILTYVYTTWKVRREEQEKQKNEFENKSNNSQQIEKDEEEEVTPVVE